MRVFACWAERASGPGWSNTLYWVLVERDGRLAVESLQPDEQSETLLALHGASAAMAETTRREAERLLEARKP